MTFKAYLTIDDTPSAMTTMLCDFLSANNVQALLYCRGDQLAENRAPVIEAVKQGMVLGNHMYHHRRSSTLSYEDIVQEIEDTARLIEQIYQDAGVTQNGRYFRFPHIDRGCGGWIVDYDTVPAHKNSLLTAFAEGLNVDLFMPSAEDQEKKARLQSYLREEGYVAPFKEINIPWYAETEVAQAVDSLFTFSSNDWMLTQRHLKRDWPCKSVGDLKQHFNNYYEKADQGSNHIILMHDQNDLGDVVLELLTHMLDKGVKFLPIEDEWNRKSIEGPA